MSPPHDQAGLFADVAQLPQGLRYQPGFITPAVEQALLAHVATLTLREARFREYFARRRVAHFHSDVAAPSQDGDADSFTSGPLPPWLLDVRERVAAVVGVPADAFVHALVSEYRPGTPIGWHRDKPVYGIVAGVSLAGSGTMRWRPFAAQDARHTFTLELEPRSLYVMRGAIRHDWQHSMPPMKALRYSITLRTRAGTA